MRNKSRCHFSAFFRTAFTLRCAFLAMFIFMLAAFVSTTFANVGANTAQVPGGIASQAHQLSGRVTNGGALHVELNTLCHHLYIIFLRAGRCAMIANCRALQTGVNALSEFVVSFHINVFQKGVKLNTTPKICY